MLRKSCWLYLAIAAAVPALLLGQSFTAAIRGVITDVSQAAIPGAKVVVTDAGRNTEHTTQTDALGRYVLAALPPGTYTLSVEAAGFQKHSRSAFVLQVQQQATIDVELQVGQIASVIEVAASGPLLNTTIANLGQVIENRYINQLPLINRNIFALTYLTPGVVGAAGAYTASESTNFSAVGTRNSTADVMLDGVSITTPEQNSGITTPAQTPSVDAVQEFKVQTSFFSAEFGNTGGAIVNMITKSGTNDFHGSGYWFYRHDSLNANSFFSNRAGRLKPSYHRHLYGGTGGGPIKKDRTFFFFSYERLPEGSPYSQTATFPTAQQRQGNFSDYVTSSGQPITIYNPFDTFTNAAGDIKRRPFPGNIIPRSMLNPISMAAASYYPAANQPGLVNNWFEQGIATSVNYQMEIKADHNFSDRSRISARYSPRRSRFARPNLFGEGRPGLPWEIKRTLVDANGGVFDYTRTLNPQTIFNVRFGLLNPNYYSTQLVYFDLKKLGLPQYIEDAALKINPNARLFPQVSVGGLHRDRGRGVHGYRPGNRLQTGDWQCDADRGRPQH